VQCLTLCGAWRFFSLVVFLGLAVTALTNTAPGQTTSQVTVPANPDWTDTGIALSAGEVATISASGTWNDGCGLPDFGPDGNLGCNGWWNEFEFFDIADHGRLIGFVGLDPFQAQWGSSIFFPQTSGYISVGSGQTFIAPYAGDLWLGIDDDAVDQSNYDNSGQLIATITVGGSDATAPAIAIVAPTTVYTLNQKVAAKYSCADPDDAVMSCAGPVANGAPVDTSYEGLHAFTVVAVDSHGNSASKTAVYLVANVGLAPQSLAYPPQFGNTTSPTQKVTLFNRQGVPLNISGIGTTGVFNATTTCPPVLAPRASCSISVTFKPNGFQEESIGYLSVADDVGTQYVVLVGFGTEMKLSPAKVTYTRQKVGTISPAKKVTLDNAWTGTLNVSSINLSGDFALAPSTTCPSNGVVSQGTSCTIAITFTPTGVGTRAGTLIVQADYPTAPVVVQLSGTGTR
jgi:hypothetical protein